MLFLIGQQITKEKVLNVELKVLYVHDFVAILDVNSQYGLIVYIW